VSELPKRILYATSELAGTQEVFSFLEKQGVKVSTAVDLSTCLYHLNNSVIEVAVIQSEFPELRGLAIAQRIRAHQIPDKAMTGIVLIQGRKDIPKGDSMLAVELGGVENIAYPFKGVQLIPYLQRVYAWRRQELAFFELNSKVIAYHRKAGSFDKALEAVKKKIPELGAKGPQLMIELYKDANRFDEALALVDGLIARSDKEDIRLINTRGMLLLKLGRMDEAKEVLEKADKLAPDNIQRLESMADVYLEKNDPDSALKAMSKVVKMKPDQPEGKFGMFDKLCKRGFAEHARKLCQETTLPEEIVRHYNNKGVLLAKEGSVDVAMASYEQALIFFPNHKENYKIHFNMALAHINAKKPDSMARARVALKKVLDLEPEFEKGKILSRQFTLPRRSRHRFVRTRAARCVSTASHCASGEKCRKLQLHKCLFSSIVSCHCVESTEFDHKGNRRPAASIGVHG